MKIIELDLTGCQYLAEIHERIRVALSFPEWKELGCILGFALERV